VEEGTQVLDHAAGEPEPPTHLATEAALSAAQANRDEQLLFVAALRDALARHNIHIPVPLPNEHIFLLRGVPVVPWIPLRAADAVWSAWLDRLQSLWEGWGHLAGSPFVDWPAWRDEHVHLLAEHHTRVGVEDLAYELSRTQLAGVGVHLVGHSVGGGAALAYLAELRAGIVDQPLARLRSVVTLDASVFGIAGVWTGTRQTLRAGAARAFKGLGAWSAERGIGVLTACNERDMWSHRAIADLPYVGMRLGPRHGTLSQIDGRIHGLLRRTPELVEAIWTPTQEYLPAVTGPLSSPSSTTLPD
jgi:hypothetical protein